MTEIQPTGSTTSSLGGLIDALDVVLAGGAVVAGDVVIALDGIDLIKVDLRVLIAGIQGVPVMDGGT